MTELFNKLLDVFKNLWLKVKDYLIALAKNLWEDYLKDKLQDDIQNLLVRGVELAKSYYGTEAYEKKKEAVLTYVFDNINLPTWLKPFKWLVKIILTNVVENKIEELLDSAENLIDKQA